MERIKIFFIIFIGLIAWYRFLLSIPLIILFLLYGKLSRNFIYKIITILYSVLITIVSISIFTINNNFFSNGQATFPILFIIILEYYFIKEILLSQKNKKNDLKSVVKQQDKSQ